MPPTGCIAIRFGGLCILIRALIEGSARETRYSHMTNLTGQPSPQPDGRQSEFRDNEGQIVCFSAWDTWRSKLPLCFRTVSAICAYYYCLCVAIFLLGRYRCRKKRNRWPTPYPTGRKSTEFGYVPWISDQPVGCSHRSCKTCVLPEVTSPSTTYYFLGSWPCAPQETIRKRRSQSPRRLT